MSTVSGMVQVLARNWWALALRGVAALVFGLIALLMPGLTLVALVILFGAYSLVDGVFAVAAAVRAAETHHRWAWLLVEGLTGILTGIITFLWPGITAIVLLYLIALWAIVTGVLEVVAGFNLRGHLANEWLLLLGGVASIIFGVVLILQPMAGALALTWLIGLYALVFGVLMLILAFRMRGHSLPPAGVAPRPA
ncbi:MAG TPA: HdeD family acid-resistance protein [bacterium]|nr:HdeD family acid-resistance protein [bacterium]